MLEPVNANLVPDPNSQAYCKSSLTFDGIDGRGADRPQSEQRNAGILSSNADVWATVLQREHPVGEGDLKLTDVCDRVHKTAMRDPEGPLGSVVLNLIQTIDTDSLLIELMQEWDIIGWTEIENRVEHKRDKLKQWSDLVDDED